MIWETPERYAKHLATYIASPTKIESLTRLEFDSAPPLHWIANERYRVETAARKFRTASEPKSRSPTAAEGEDYVLPTLLRDAAPPRRPRVLVAIDFNTRPAIEPTNPFLQPWCLTRAVVASVATDFGLCAAHVAGKSRRQEYVWARAVAVKLLNECGLSAAGIGRKLGRDHSTILHALDNFATYERQSETVGASYRRHKALMAEAEESVAA